LVTISLSSHQISFAQINYIVIEIAEALPRPVAVAKEERAGRAKEEEERRREERQEEKEGKRRGEEKV